jgi:hypothetical protein
VCHVSLYDEYLLISNSIHSSDRRQRLDKSGAAKKVDVFLDVLTGQKSIPGTILMDPETGNPQLFFVFSDLAIRLIGTFILCCDIIDMKTYI